jgi:hypothetical protein
MIYGGSLSSRPSRPRDDVSIQFEDRNLDQRLPASPPGAVPGALARLAELGVSPGTYSGVEQVCAAGAASMATAIDVSTCTVGPTGALAVASRATGEITTFTWVNDRWSWSPYAGLAIQARPRRFGAVLVIDFVACERERETPAARVYLATDARA